MADISEQLIDRVKCYPVLYDRSDKNFKNKKFKDGVWDKIAEAIGEKDGKQVRCRWKNLRDSYSKYLRTLDEETLKRATHLARYKTWPWVDRISYLRPHIEVAAKGDSYSPEEQSTKREDKRKEPPPSTDKVRRYLRDLEDNASDSDLIFLGYSKTIKKMSQARQASVKFAVAKIIMEAEMEHFEETAGQGHGRANPSATVAGLFIAHDGPRATENTSDSGGEQSQAFAQDILTALKHQEKYLMPVCSEDVGVTYSPPPPEQICIELVKTEQFVSDSD